MTASVVQELLVKFSGDVTGLKRASENASAAVGGVSKAANVASIALKSFVGAVSIGAITNAAAQTLRWADDLGDLSITLGTTTEQVQALQYAAIANGSSVNEVNTAMLRFTNVVGEAATAGGPLLDRFNDLGISIFDANGQVQNLASILPQAADAIANANTAQEKLNIATDFFGRQAAPSMVRLLGEGAVKLSELEQAAKDAGAVLDEEMIKKAAEINGKWELLTHTIGVNFKGALITSIDYITKMRQAAVEAADVINEKLFGIERPIYATPIEPEVYAIPYEEPVATPFNRGNSSNPSKISGSSHAASVIKEVKEEAQRAAPSFERLNYTVSQVSDTAENMGDNFKDSFSHLSRSIASGQNAFQSLRNVALSALSDIGNSLLGMAMGGGSGGGIGGLIAGGIGKLFGGVTATSGPMAGQTVFPTFATGANRIPNDMLAMVHKGERIIPARDAGKGSGTSVTQNINIGNNVAQIARAEIQRMLPVLSQAAVGSVKNASMRGA